MADKDPTGTFVTAWSLGVDPDTLGPAEHRLFTVLARDAYRVFTKDDLISRRVARSPRELDSVACRLHARFTERRVIINVWGVGYRLLEPQETER